MSLVAGINSGVDTSPIFGVSFLVLATKIMRPGHVYRLMVTNYSPQLVTAHASILRDGLDVASAEQQCSTGVPETIMLRVPPQALDGLYKLKIEGRTETDEVVFANETALEFSRKSITIFIQTDKPIYRQGQVVKIRTVPITTDLKPFSDALDVYMLDPNGIIVKRWLSKQTNLGSVSIEYPLSDQPVKGNWTIRVFAQGQIQDSHFLVEEYYPQQYEIKVTMPSEFLDTEEFIKGSIMANYTSGAPVGGNLTVVISAEQAGYSASATEAEDKFNGFLEFRYKMQDLRRLLNNRIENAKITVAAFVGERYLDLVQTGYAKSVISSSRIKLKFVGPSVFVFKPYMTFDCYLASSYQGGAALTQDQLRSSLLDVRLTAMNKFGSMLLPNRTFEVVTTTPGIWRITIDVRNYMNKQTLLELDHLKLDATFFDRFISKASATARVYPAYSPSLRSLQITTSTTTAKVGDYAVFHVSSNYKLDLITYVVITKGLIMTGGRERIKSSPTTFAIPVSAEMVPTSTILVYDISKNEEIVMDSLAFHVDGTSLQNFTVILNPNKDKHGESLEVAVYGQPGTYVGLTAFNQDLYSLSNTGQLDTIHFDQQMQDFDRRTDLVSHHWLTQDGRIQEIVNFPSPTLSVDAYHLLESVGLIAFTDAVIPRRSNAVCSQNLVKCLIMDKCYNATLSRCNGLDDCGDTSDESNCDKNDSLYKTQERLHRGNRLLRLYEDNWLWKDINIGPLGHYIFTVKLPTAISTWSVNAFSMSPHNGIGMLSAPIEISNSRPFLFRMEMPNSCNLGEQIGVRALVSNYLPKEIEVNIILANSPHYKFVLVGDSGEVSSYSPDTTYGEQQHLITVKSGDTALVYLPIVAQKLGEVNVTVSAVTQVAKRTVSRLLHVEADGIPQNSHIAIDLDLSRGSYMIKHLDTNVTESPVVKYDKVRRYIYGSNKASISISGGVVGPMFPTMPMDSNSTLRLPSDCGEQNMFNFAINLMSISYLRQTGQESPELKKEIFKHLNILYQKQLGFRNRDGSFRIFKSSSEPSVWLTAFVARFFHQATAQEWENYIYVDPDVIDSAIGWLVSKQTVDGAFVEQGPYAYDRKLDNTQRMGFPFEDYRLKNVSLTAYALIALQSVKDRAGEQATKANNARVMAQKYLESLLHRTTVKTAQDPFDLALVAYALQLVNSIEADEAYVHLEKRLHSQSGLRYWSTEPVVSNNLVNVQSNRNLIYPRSRGRFDSKNVQTTAYGLLTLIQRQVPYQRDVVDWLNTQRLSESGWASTQDTLVALQALMEYSLSSDHRSVTDIKIAIEAPALRDANRENRVSISEANISQVHSFNIPNVHGILTVRAEGSGTALLSLDIQYNVDWPHLQIKPAIKAFDLDIRPSYSGRNSSNMNMEICSRWTLLTESSRSGMAVLEVPVPTGYMVSQSVLDKIVNSSASAIFSYPRNLREARVTERKIYFYFDYIDDKKTCVKFTMDRWFPVANMTRFMPVKIYEYYAPAFIHDWEHEAVSIVTQPHYLKIAAHTKLIDCNQEVDDCIMLLLSSELSNRRLIMLRARRLFPLRSLKLTKLYIARAEDTRRWILGTVQVPPGPLKPTRPSPAPGGTPPIQNAASLGPIPKSIGPLLQAAIAVAPKVALPPAVASLPQMQPTPVIKKPLPIIGLQQGSGGAVQPRLRGEINQEEPIVLLDYSSINDEVLNKRTANFVYFNANFNQCRHCQRFFSIWKDLALDIRWWRNVIKLFTINCSDEDNIDVCRRAGVTQFPQLKFYWVMSKNLNQDGQRLRILGKSVHAMRHLIMDKVLDSYLEHNRLLGQRERQRASSASSNPLSAIMPGGPLSSLVPMMNQLISNTSGTPASSGGGGLGGMGVIMGMLTGKPTAGGLSLTSLMSSIGGMQGISQLINALMSMSSWQRSLSLQPLPSNWPELQAINPSDTQKLINALPIGPGRASGALLIMETQEFLYTGLEVMLDLNPYTLNQTYYIERVRDERSQLCKNLTKLDDVQAPAMIYVNELRQPKLIITAPKYTNDEDLRRVFVRAFERRQIKYPLKRVWSASGLVGGSLGRVTNSSEADEEIILQMNDIYMNDLLNTIRLSLTDQVLRHTDLSDDQYNALVKYVYVLINYFPFNNDEHLKFFKRLHSWLQNQVSPVDISEYKKQFHDVDDVMGKKRDWVACKSLSNVNSVPSRKKSGFLFDNPSQIGKVVSNITRLFRANQQKVGQLKNLVGMFASGLNSPVVLTDNNQQRAGGQQQNRGLGSAFSTSTTSPPTFKDSPSSSRPPAPSSSRKSEKKEESSLEKLIKSLTSGSLGSDSSILKLISTALGGGGDSKPGKSKFAREYSCGSWKLAHVMVVNEYIRDSPRKDVKHIVLHSLYQYMLHFYACSACGNRVSDVSSEFRLNLDDHLLDQGDSIMLLWKIHNRINKRLESEIRPGSPPKQQFPSEALCPKCRAPKKPTDPVSTPNWYEKQVLNFLVHHYRPQNIETNVNSSSGSSAAIISANPNISLILSFLIIALFWQSVSLNGCLMATMQNNYRPRSDIIL